MRANRPQPPNKAMDLAAEVARLRLVRASVGDGQDVSPQAD